jgi:enediyne biosynthesis protein E4
VSGEAGHRRRLLSRRQSRSLIAGLVSLLLLVAVGALAFVRRAPARYDPSQAAEGITSELARRIPAGRPHVSFGDAASSSGLVFTHFSGERSTQLPEDMGSGAAWGDIDNDGDDDLFIVNVSGALPTSGGPGGAGRGGRGATSRLFRNDAGRFVDVTERAGLVREICGMAAAWGDADGDGWLDLVVTSFDRLHLFRNRGDGTFENRTASSGLAAFAGFWTGASWADYDRDGDLDLYICGYVRYRFDPIGAGRVTLQGDAESPFTLNPASYPPERNLLLRNDGAGRFVDVAARAGVDNAAGRSLSAAWCDFDGDGWLDLYVANDVSDNALFRNRGNGRFENVSHAAWVADPRGAMGLAVGDWDLDGDFDIFVTHWLAQENALFSNLRIMARGEPPDRMVFMDIADQTGLGQISLDYVKWGTAFFDYDNDGRPDLLSINGSTFQDPSNPRRLLPMRHQLFWNRGEREGFFDVAPVSGAPLNETTVGRGAAVSDYDGDGDVDVLVVNHGSAARLLRNDGGNARRWLKVRVRGRRNRFGFGALVSVTAGGATQQQQVGSQPSYLSQHSLTLHFGLGDQPHADEIVVRFPGGVEVRQTAVRANQTITVEEPGR